MGIHVVIKSGHYPKLIEIRASYLALTFVITDILNKDKQEVLRA